MQSSPIAALETVQSAERLGREGKVASHVTSVACCRIDDRIANLRACDLVALGVWGFDRAEINTFVGASV
jgi:hypothetical protein